MKKFILLPLILMVMVCCKKQLKTEDTKTETAITTGEKIAAMHWLLGTWTNKTETEYSQETWTLENDRAFTAFSFTEKDGEVIFAETMVLQQKPDDLWLTVATPNQKEAEPVTFKLVSSQNGQFTFENEEHDFPQRIVYTNPAKDSLHAWIEGSINGEKKKMEFYFSRKE